MAQRIVTLLGIVGAGFVLARGAVFAESAAPPPWQCHVEGTLAFYSYNAEGILLHDGEKRFFAEVCSSNWQFRTIDHFNADRGKLAVPTADGLKRSDEVACDGTNLYWLHIDQAVITNGHARAFEEVSRTAKVQVAGRPLPGPDLTALLWFAFEPSASARPEQGWRPIWPVEEALFKSPARWKGWVQPLEAGSSPPLRALFLNPGQSWTLTNGQVVAQTCAQPLDQGFTNAVFEVTDIVSVRGRPLPKSFSLRVFAPDPRNPGRLYNCFKVVEHTVQASFMCPQAGAAPALQQPTPVTDLRGCLPGSAASLSYVCSNHWVLSTNGAEFRAALQGARYPELPPRRAQLSWLSMMALVLVGGFSGLAALTVHRLRRG